MFPARRLKQYFPSACSWQWVVCYIGEVAARCWELSGSRISISPAFHGHSSHPTEPWAPNLPPHTEGSWASPHSWAVLLPGGVMKTHNGLFLLLEPVLAFSTLHVIQEIPVYTSEESL